MMVLSKTVSYWTVAEVFDWVKEQYSSPPRALQQAIAKHAISGRVLLRLNREQLSNLGVDPKFQQQLLQDVLQLKVLEGLENLSDIYAGEKFRL